MSCLFRFGLLLMAALLVSCSSSQTAPTPAKANPPEVAKSVDPAKLAVVAPTPVRALAQPLTPPAGLKSDGSISGIIKIVSSLPRTGSFVGSSNSMVNGYKLALELVNSQVAGAKIELLDWDDAGPIPGKPGEFKWDGVKEAENATKAVNDADVMVYLGTYNSGAAKIAIPILNRANMVMISPGNTYPGLTKPGKGEPNEPTIYRPTGVPNYSRVIAADDLQGAAGANWAKQIGVRRVYILDDTELYGHGIAVVFAETARRIGLEIVGGPVGIDIKAPDYKALAAKLRNISPDLIYYGGITDNNAAQLIKDLRTAVGPNVKFMGPDGIYEKAFITAAGKTAEGTLVTFPGVHPSKLGGKGAGFYEAYKAKYGEPEAFAAYAYEAMMVALNAIQKAGVKDRAAIRDAVFATSEFDGILGKWSFDENGDTTLTEMSGRMIVNDNFDDQNAITLRAD